MSGAALLPQSQHRTGAVQKTGSYFTGYQIQALRSPRSAPVGQKFSAELGLISFENLDAVKKKLNAMVETVLIQVAFVVLGLPLVVCEESDSFLDWMSHLAARNICYIFFCVCVSGLN